MTSGNQTSQITPNSEKEPLIKSKDLLEGLNLRLLYNVIFSPLPASATFSFKVTNSQLDDYPW